MFHDLQSAFVSYSDKELKKARWLFSMLKYPLLVKMGKVLMRMAIFLKLPVFGFIKKNIFKHFCGGETQAECMVTVDKLYLHGVQTILDFSAEGGTHEEDFEAVFAEISSLIIFLAEHPAIPFAVFKPTGIMHPEVLTKVAANQSLSEAETILYNNGKNRFYKLCELAAQKNLPLLIDAEESWIQHPIDELCLEMMQKWNREKPIIFNTLQMYRTDRISYLQHITNLASKEKFFIGLKLVRGAYMEKERLRAAKMGYPSPICATKEDTDISFNTALEFCFTHKNIIHFCCASHNEDSCGLLAALMQQNNIAHNQEGLWFAQLYGMSNHISFNLAKQNYSVCKYVPYGKVKTVMPYLIRRAEENTSVKGQTGRELQLLEAEINRRKANR